MTALEAKLWNLALDHPKLHLHCTCMYTHARPEIYECLRSRDIASCLSVHVSGIYLRVPTTKHEVQVPEGNFYHRLGLPICFQEAYVAEMRHFTSKHDQNGMFA